MLNKLPFFLFLLCSCSLKNEQPTIINIGEKINGASIEAPRKEVQHWVKPLERISADWVAIIPYAYQEEHGTQIHYDTSLFAWQWWGEREIGVRTMVKNAKENGLKVLLKPQLWVMNSWPGSLNYSSEKEWEKWEFEYRNYLLRIAKIAAEEQVDLLCMGTELRFSAQRTNYWINLIAKIKQTYSGPLTYAANWDNYEKIEFWSQLDYIGIDAYFPLEETPNATKQDLLDAWKPIEKQLGSYIKKHNKPLLFTEYGYRSMASTTYKTWEKEDQPLPVQLKEQSIAYEALYECFWNKPWFAGGFLWKWICRDETAGGKNNSFYTPQHKPVELVIKTTYSKN